MVQLITSLQRQRGRSHDLIAQMLRSLRQLMVEMQGNISLVLESINDEIEFIDNVFGE